MNPEENKNNPTPESSTDFNTAPIDPVIPKTASPEPITFESKPFQPAQSSGIENAAYEPAPIPDEIKIQPPAVNIPNLRTYKDDIKEVVDSNDISSTRILLDEQKRRANEAATRESNSLSSGKNKTLLFISLTLLIIAGAILGGVWFYPKVAPGPSRILIERNAFLEVDGQTAIPIELRNARDILNDVKRLLVSNIPVDTIEELLLSRTTKQESGGSEVSIPTPISTDEFLQLVESRAPAPLVRSLAPEFMLALYGDTVVRPFLLFKINDFENVFASMFTWEATLARDMQPIFFPNVVPQELSHPRFTEAELAASAPTQPATATGTPATSSTTAPAIPQKPQLSFDPTIFYDRIIQNTDGRALVNDQGEMVFFYTFINDEYLIFANSEETLVEVVRRLRQSRLIR